MRGRVWQICALAMAMAVAPAAAGVRPGPALLYAKPPAAPQLTSSAPFAARPLLVSGTDAYRSGEYVYQDYLYDDHGADTKPGLGNSQSLSAPTAGDVQYPAGHATATTPPTSWSCGSARLPM